MTRTRWFAKARVVLSLLAFVAALHVEGHGQTARLYPHRIAVFGSSVAFGNGDEYGREGYTGLLRQMMAARGWEVLNQSRPGDNTKTVVLRLEPQATPDPKLRYLLPMNPAYAVIGLSLGNEGVLEAKTKEDKDAIYKQYADGTKGLIDTLRQHNIVPVLALAYARSDFTPVEYEYTRRMNVLQNTWDLPSINVLGAIDDGQGRWAPGFTFDVRHPNASGHKEFSYAIVPTLFEALEKGKPLPSKPADARGFARIAKGVEPLTFEPPEVVHPFAISVMVRTQGDGTVAAVSGSTLAAKTEAKTFGGPGKPVRFDSTTLSVDRPFTATIGVQNGKWTYRPAAGSAIASGVQADGLWHHVVLSHYTARGETLFFVDGQLAGRTGERLQPNRFVLGGPGKGGSVPGPKEADYKDFFLFRSALNADEVAVLHEGKLLQASLEIYSPLADTDFAAGGEIENRAQSLTALKKGPDRITRAEEKATR
jgi:lysophospholipase L1-like esterase